jgi:hypothetical protein
MRGYLTRFIITGLITVHFLGYPHPANAPCSTANKTIIFLLLSDLSISTNYISIDLSPNNKKPGWGKTNFNLINISRGNNCSLKNINS